MNTIRSVYYGWATLIVAGGGAYYFAKKSINADRARKADAEHQKRMAQYQLEQALLSRPSQNAPPSQTNGTHAANLSPPAPSAIIDAVGKRRGESRKGNKEREREDRNWHEQVDEASNPSQEASQDPAPTRHAPEDEAQKMREKSKYEAADVYRSRKGDRFS